jgi:hypothetical protein
MKIHDFHISQKGLEKMKSKRAMTSIASTIILIGFAAMLGLVVMSWGTSIADSMPDECSKVTLSISTEGNSIMVVPKVNNLVCNDKRLDISEVVK